MAHPQIAVFARLAKGNAPTVRRIMGQATRLGRTTHSILYNELRDEIVVVQPFAAAILTFPGGADGETAPLRIIQGSKTQLALPDVMTIDQAHNEYFVPTGQGSGVVNVFPGLEQGDVAPLRSLGSRATGLGGNCSVDYTHNLFLVRARDGLRIYDRTASGDPPPLRLITDGPKAGAKEIGSQFILWIPGTRNFVANAREWNAVEKDDWVLKQNHPLNFMTADQGRWFIGVWSIDDDGEVAPRYAFAKNYFQEIRTAALDPKHKEIIVADKTGNSVTTYDIKEAWEPFTPEKAPRYKSVRPGYGQEDPRY